MALNKLSARKVETLSKPGWYNDGGGLYLRIPEGRPTKWVYIFKRDTKRREMGLGALADVSLAVGRELAASARQMVKDGLDPIEERKAAVAKAAEEAATAARELEGPAPRCLEPLRTPTSTPTRRDGATPSIGSNGATQSRRTPSRSEEHTSELQSLMRISYAVFCLKKKKHKV